MKGVVGTTLRVVTFAAAAMGMCGIPMQDCIAEVSAAGIASSEPFNMTSSMIRMLGGFLFCLGLFAAGLHLYKRFFIQTSGKFQRRLRILERLPITQKNSLILVELDGRELLLTTGPDSPKMLLSHPKRDHSFDEALLDADAIGEEYNA